MPIKDGLVLFTHCGTAYGIPVWFDKSTELIVGQNKFYDFLLDKLILFHQILSFVFMIDFDGIPVVLGEELDKDGLIKNKGV